MLVRVAMVISQDWSFSRIVPSNPIVPWRSEHFFSWLVLEDNPRNEPRQVSSYDLDGFCKDVARLWQEEGGHCLLVGQGRVEVVQHLVQDRVDNSLQGGFCQVEDDGRLIQQAGGKSIQK